MNREDLKKQIANIITQTHKTPLEQSDEIMNLVNVTHDIELINFSWWLLTNKGQYSDDYLAHCKGEYLKKWRGIKPSEDEIFTCPFFMGGLNSETHEKCFRCGKEEWQHRR